MNRDKIIEVMASGICSPGTPCEACRNSAERALSALHAKGLTTSARAEDVRQMREALENIASSEPNGIWAQKEAIEALTSKEV